MEQTNDILDISSGLLHISGDSLVPELINKDCLHNARVLYQVDKKFIPVMANGRLMIIDQVFISHLLLIYGERTCYFLVHILLTISMMIVVLII